MWLAHGVLDREEAERRIDEVLVVATDPEGQPVGVESVYLQYDERLQASFWYFRSFVVPQHRQGRLSTLMGIAARDRLEQRFVDGEDRRAIGMIFEVQYEPWKVLGGAGVWVPIDFTLIGETDRGDHVRVRYFPGAQVPEPRTSEPTPSPTA